MKQAGTAIANDDEASGQELTLYRAMLYESHEQRSKKTMNDCELIC